MLPRSTGRYDIEKVLVRGKPFLGSYTCSMGYTPVMANQHRSLQQPTTSDPTGAAAKDPDEWVTGDEPMTGAQASYLATLAHDTGTEVPEQLSKAEASKLIDELQQRSPRAGG